MDGGKDEVMNLLEEVVMTTASSKGYAIMPKQYREPDASYTGLLGHVKATMLRKA